MSKLSHLGLFLKSHIYFNGEQTKSTIISHVNILCSWDLLRPSCAVFQMSAYELSYKMKNPKSKYVEIYTYIPLIEKSNFIYISTCEDIFSRNTCKKLGIRMNQISFLFIPLDSEFLEVLHLSSDNSYFLKVFFNANKLIPVLWKICHCMCNTQVHKKRLYSFQSAFSIDWILLEFNFLKCLQ